MGCILLTAWAITEAFYELAFSQVVQGHTRREAESDRPWFELNVWCSAVQHQRWTERRLQKRIHPWHRHMGPAADRRPFVAAVQWSTAFRRWTRRSVHFARAALIPGLDRKSTRLNSSHLVIS